MRGERSTGTEAAVLASAGAPPENAAGDDGAPPEDAAGDDGDLSTLSDEARIHRVLTRELGGELADAFLLARETQERWERRRHPHDGLRERKKRRTRQKISDVATVLFLVRGFDRVTVSEIAEIVGVSEKTVFNYFPTKESLLFDRTDEALERMVSALRTREQGESPTRAILRAFAQDMDDVVDMPDQLFVLLPLFNEMVAATPSLRAAWLELNGRVVQVATEELASLADVDPRDPEPMIAARAIGALHEVAFTSEMRHIEDGLRGARLREAVLGDLERAARLLDAGLWSFNLLTQGARTRAQLREAAAAAEDARRQVLEALKQARSAWHELTGHERGDRRGARGEPLGEPGDGPRERGRRRREERGKTRNARADARREPGELRRAAKELAQQAAFEAFRHKLQERHEALRARQDQVRRRRDP
ncbi:MAG TPA: TetR family transcriptional regulator [Solirubrobacteraceae bacterium]|nr:TetR family transcriptional regulator [Solirubrobacteraceae bacterium]